MAKYLDMPGLTYFYNQIKNRFASKTDVGAPTTASTSSAMTNHNKIYVYTGSEDGYTFGDWYYYDNGSWRSGGQYHANVYETNKTLSVEGVPADAKATGDEIAGLKSSLHSIQNGEIDFSVIPDSYVTKTSGRIAPYEGWDRTDFISVSGISTISVKMSVSSEYNCFYDSQKNFIPDSNFTVGTTNTTIEIPSNANYVIFSNTSEGLSDLEIGVISKKTLEIENRLNSYDASNVLSLIPKKDDIVKGISFTWNDNGSCTVSGYVSATTILAVYDSPNALPSWAVPGETYKINYNSDHVSFFVYPYYDGVLGNPLVGTLESDTITLPKTMSGLLIRLTIRDNKVGVTINETVRPIMSRSDEEYKKNDYINRLPLAYYYKFEKSGIDTSAPPVSLSYSSASTRRTAIVTTDVPHEIEMISSEYVFRLYWFDDDDNLLSTAWGRNWEIPRGFVVGIVIKRADNASFSSDEIPQFYLRTYNDTPKEYYKAEINSVVERVKAANTEPGLCFLLSTDQHTMSVQGSLVKHDTISDMVTNMKEVAKKIHFDANISLGDLTDQKVGDISRFEAYGIIDNTDPSKLNTIFYKWLDSAMDKLASVHPNFIYIPGNHDDNRYINKDVVNAETSAYDYSPGEMYSYYTQRSQLRRVPNMNNNGLDYYIDFPDFKIRMFCLDANYYYDSTHTSPHGYKNCWWYGFQDETASWMDTQLSLVPNDWSVLVCSHLSPVKENNADNTTYVNMSSIRNSIQSFIDNGGNYIATFYGHSHVDWATTSPWLEISFDCQKCINNTPNLPNMSGATHATRTSGTATEDCWNVVIVQPNSRKIKVIRFGAGNDREFSY